MRAARPTIRRFLKIVGRASLTRRLPRHPLPEGEGTHDKQVSVFEDRPEPHPAWVSGELIAVFRTLVGTDRPYNLQFQRLRSVMEYTRAPHEDQTRSAWGALLLVAEFGDDGESSASFAVP